MKKCLSTPLTGKNVLKESKLAEARNLAVTSTSPTFETPSSKIPGRLRRFAAGVRRPGFAKDAREAIQKVIITSTPSQSNLSPANGRTSSQKSDTLGSADSLLQRELTEVEKKSSVSSGSSIASVFIFDSVSSTKSSGRVRKFANNIGPPGSAKEARNAVQKAIKMPKDHPTISSILDYEKILREGLIRGNNSHEESSLLQKDEVENLVRQLRNVLEATHAIVSASYDQIKLTELHIQLADSYRGFAAYRSLWFEALAELHSASGWHSEAAVAYAHSFTIIARELALNGLLINPDWSLLDWISSAIAVEEHVHEGDLGIIQPGGFTLEDLLTKMEKCRQELVLAERLEAIGPLYRFLIPTLELNGNYNLLASMYGELQRCSSRASEVITNRRRHLASYYKVVFLGEKHFGDLHKSEWIYRETGLTTLSEISSSLFAYCRHLIGHDKIKIESENELDRQLLDKNYAYVMITHVEPLCEVKEKLNFRTHTNLSTFFYESPTVEDCDGTFKEEPPLHKQGVRRTIVNVVGSFPSNRRRLPIDKNNREQITLLPLQYAAEKLQTKASQIMQILNSAENGKQLDIKGLQLLLQGALMPTVNAGPLAYAEAFSQPEQLKRYGYEGVEKLCDSFRQLMKACELGLQANSRVVGSDQRKYHEMLVKSAEMMISRLTGFFGEMFPTTLELNSEYPRSKSNSLDSTGRHSP